MGAFSSVTRSAVVFAGYGPEAGNRFKLVRRVVQQALVVGAEIRTPFIGADAEHDDAELREIARRECVRADQSNIGAQLLDRIRHAIADAHHVAHLDARRDGDVE